MADGVNTLKLVFYFYFYFNFYFYSLKLVSGAGLCGLLQRRWSEHPKARHGLGLPS
jgi:hypothetical protein